MLPQSVTLDDVPRLNLRDVVLTHSHRMQSQLSVTGYGPLNLSHLTLSSTLCHGIWSPKPQSPEAVFHSLSRDMVP